MKNIMLKIIPLLFLVSLIACERDYSYETISLTPPELHVVVKYNDNQPVVNARVRLFDSREDYNAGAPDLANMFTDDEGLAVFTREQLKSPGIFYVAASLGTMNNSNSNIVTPYILLNDGHTRFFTKIE